MQLFAAGISGFLAVALGAFGAHGLKSRLSETPDFADRMAWWTTASHYHLVHSLLLLGLGLIALQKDAPSGPLKVATWATVVGVFLFSGSLYTMTLTGVRWLGAITPLGGTAFLVAWASLALLGWQIRSL